MSPPAEVIGAWMPNTPPSLLIRLRDAENHRSWRTFFERYWRLIYSFAIRSGLKPSDAEDVLQDVVVEVFRAMPRFEYDRTRGTFRAWLRTIAQHKVADHLRRAAKRQMQTSHPQAIDRTDFTSGLTGYARLSCPAAIEAEQAWERDWRRNLLQVCLERVSHEVEPKTYQAFQLYALENWSARETARLLKMSVASVYMARSRVAARVRELFEKESDEA